MKMRRRRVLRKHGNWARAWWVKFKDGAHVGRYHTKVTQTQVYITCMNLLNS